VPGFSERLMKTKGSPKNASIETLRDRYFELVWLRGEVKRLELRTTPFRNQPIAASPKLLQFMRSQEAKWSKSKGKTRFQN
jgi:hypothetical protein